MHPALDLDPIPFDPSPTAPRRDGWTVDRVRQNPVKFVKFGRRSAMLARHETSTANHRDSVNFVSTYDRAPTCIPPDQRVQEPCSRWVVSPGQPYVGHERG